MRRKSSQTFAGSLRLSPDNQSIERVKQQLGRLPSAIMAKVLKSASRRWGAATRKLLRKLTPRDNKSKAVHLRSSIVSVVKMKKRKSGSLLTVRVGARYEKGATRTTGGAGWRLLFAERGFHAWPKFEPAPVSGRGRGWRKGLRGIKGRFIRGNNMVKATAFNMVKKWEPMIVEDIEATLRSLKT